MKEPYGKGLATRPGPESCAGRACWRHKWMLLACLLGTIAYALFSLEADCPLPLPAQDTVFWHGWPAVYMIRVSPFEPGTWYGSRWHIYRDIREFYFTAFLGDIAVAVGISLAVTFLWYLHCRNKRPWQFSIREALLGFLIVGVVLSGFEMLRQEYDQETQFLRELETRGWLLRYCADSLPWYLRPLNDLDVISEDDWNYWEIEWCPEDHKIDAGNINEILAELASSHPSLSLVHSVNIFDPSLNDQGVESLCKVAPYCTQLYLGDRLPEVTDRSVASIASHLRSLNVWSLRGAKISDEAVRCMAAMRSLNELYFDDKWKTTSGTGLNALLKLPYMHSLAVPEHWIATDEEKMAIMRQSPVSFIAPYEYAWKTGEGNYD